MDFLRLWRQKRRPPQSGVSFGPLGELPMTSLPPVPAGAPLPTIAGLGATQTLLFTASCKLLQIFVITFYFPLQVLEFLLLNRKPINFSIYLIKKCCISPPYVCSGMCDEQKYFSVCTQSWLREYLFLPALLRANLFWENIMKISWKP